MLHISVRQGKQAQDKSSESWATAELVSAECYLKNTGGVSFTTQAFPNRIGRKQKCIAGLYFLIKDKFIYFAFGSVWPDCNNLYFCISSHSQSFYNNSHIVILSKAKNLNIISFNNYTYYFYNYCSLIVISALFSAHLSIYKTGIYKNALKKTLSKKIYMV